MPSKDVASGETETIINNEMNRVLARENARHAVLHVESNAVRVVSAARIQDESQARSGFPISAGSYITGFKPQGNEIIAYGDGGGTSTVHVHLVTPESFDVAEVDL